MCSERVRARSPFLLLFAVLCPASPSVAQGTPAALIGGAANPGIPGLIQREIWCNPASQVCFPVLNAPPTPWAGGTAYDPGHQVVWDSDGVLYVGTLTTPSPTCKVICGPLPVSALGVPPGFLVTGLAFDDTTNSLWVLDSLPLLTRNVVTATSGCPQPTTRCELANVIPPTHQTGGLAISEKLRRIFYSASIFGPAGPANIVFSAPIAAPCQPDCRLQVPGCTTTPLGPITGLAYDDCDDRLYLTDGKIVVRGIYTPASAAAPCLLARLECCGAALVAPYYGLDLEASHPVRRGAVCSTPPCPSCLGMLLVENGDPALGNASFAVQITGGPTPAAAIGLLGLGPCTAGIPALCGFYYPILPPPPVVLGPVGLVGPVCGGTATFPLPVPLDPSLCGANLCVQAAVFCLGSGAGGVGLTNGLDLTITD